MPTAAKQCNVRNLIAVLAGNLACREFGVLGSFARKTGITAFTADREVTPGERPGRTMHGLGL